MTIPPRLIGRNTLAADIWLERDNPDPEAPVLMLGQDGHGACANWPDNLTNQDIYVLMMPIGNRAEITTRPEHVRFQNVYYRDLVAIIRCDPNGGAVARTPTAADKRKIWPKHPTEDTPA